MGKRCCVLIPYRDAGESLLRSLESLDAQDEVDVLVVDDGSDRLPASEVLTRYGSAVPLRVMRLDRNVGIAHALNAGLEELGDSYEYIARLDCGDLCLEGRLTKQIRFLDDHPDCYLVGTWAEFVSVEGERRFVFRPPTDSEGIRRRMFVNSAFVHPTVMFRSALLAEVGPYPTDRPAAEDYAFFRAVAQRHEVANLPEPLLRYVVDPGSISSVSRRQQLASRLKVQRQHFEWKPLALYGVVRTLVQLVVSPRAVSVVVNRLRERLSGSR